MATQYTAGLTTGQVLTAATMNSIGAAAETYSPIVSQPAGIAGTVNLAKYQQVQKIVHVYLKVTLTGTGTAGNVLSCTLPVSAAYTNSSCGSGGLFDVSATTMYGGWFYLLNASTVVFAGDWATNGLWGTSPSLAVGNGDTFYATLTYEAA